MAQYRILLERDEDGFSVAFPDFPGCVSGGETAEAAVANAAEALSLHIEGMIEDGDEIPPASQLTEPVPDWCRPFLAVSLVSVELPGKAVRVNITLEENLLARIDRAAKERGIARSAFLAAGARAMLAE